MTNSLIPYSFVPGTKAMASEINANFISIADAVVDTRTFTTESIEQFNNEFETALSSSLDNKLEKNMSNSLNIANCIVEAPHMVDFVLVNNTVLLKAGSKVVIPYGKSAPMMAVGANLTTNLKIVDISWDNTNLFYICELQADRSWTYNGSTIPIIPVVYNLSTDAIIGYGGLDYSGTTEPSANNVFYNTSTNYCYRKETPNERCSLIIANVASTQGTGITTINYINQHVGHVGITVYVMKGIKGLIPNYRNEDGSLKNIEYSTQYIKTMALSGENYSFRIGVWVRSDGTISLIYYNEGHTPRSGYLIYNPAENVILNPDGNKVDAFLTGLYSQVNSTIEDFEPKQVFHAQDLTENLKIVESGTTNANGYTKLSNGLLLQWGEATWSGEPTTVTFPIAFKSTTYGLSITQLALGGTADFNDNMKINAKATSYFRFANASQPAVWFAIGY